MPKAATKPAPKPASKPVGNLPTACQVDGPAFVSREKFLCDAITAAIASEGPSAIAPGELGNLLTNAGDAYVAYMLLCGCKADAIVAEHERQDEALRLVTQYRLASFSGGLGGSPAAQMEARLKSRIEFRSKLRVNMGLVEIAPVEVEAPPAGVDDLVAPPPPADSEDDGESGPALSAADLQRLGVE